MAPVQGGAQGGLPRRDVAAAGDQQRHRVVEPRHDARQRQHAQAGRGELQRERHAVEPAAQPGDVRGVAVGHGEVRPHQPRPVGEQLHRRAVGEVGGARRGQLGGHRQTLQPPGALPRRRQRFPAGRQDPQAGTGRQQLTRQGGAAGDQVLAVVQHQHPGPLAQARGDRLRQGAAGHLGHLHRTGHGGGQQRRTVELGQRHPPGRQPGLGGEPVPHGVRQPGLAAAARAHQAQQPGPADGGEQGRHLRLAPDEPGQRRGRPGRRDSGRRGD